MRKYIIEDTSEESLAQLWSVSYKQYLLPMLSHLGEARLAALVWTTEEDMLILRFYFDQQTLRRQTAQLLTRKTLDCLVERYRFMNLPVS
jgi:hypothetical protein